MTQAELLNELETLKAQNEILRSKLTLKKPGTLTFKVSTKGAVSVYGLGRFPVSLYSAQWQRLMERRDDLLAYITANASSLSTKEVAA